MTDASDLTKTRKRQHLDAFRSGARTDHADGTWLDCVRLIHQALPELHASGIDLSTTFAGHRFKAPFFITGMTGGTPEAQAINEALARQAERLGLGFGLGSQRAMLLDPKTAPTFRMRHVAPSAFIAGNIGAVQAREAEPKALIELVKSSEIDALCVHLNAAQELMQPEGDRDFRGLLDALARLVDTLPCPLIVKETGAGLSRECGEKLAAIGVRAVDVAGAGGTSWVAVEASRRGLAPEDPRASLAEWGLPTAASLGELDGLNVSLLASGGLRDARDAASALALGADMAGLAAPLLRAYWAGGEEGLASHLDALIEGLRTVLLLTSCENLAALRKAPRVVLDPLAAWLTARRPALP